MKRHIIIVGLFLLLALAFAVCAVPAATESAEKKMSKKATKLFSAVSKAIQEKKLDQALDLLQQIVPLEPENAKVRYFLGVLFHQKRMFDESILNIEETLRLQQDFPNAQQFMRKVLYEAGSAAYSKQNFERSNSYFIKLIDLPYVYLGKENDTILTNTRFYLGSNYFNLKQYPQAQVNFEWVQALEGLELENLDLYSNATYFIGMINYIKEQFQDSIYHFTKYLTLYEKMEQKPQLYSHAHYFIGANLFRLLEAKMAKGEVAGMAEATAEILPYLNAAVENKIPSEDAHVMLGNCYVYQKDYDKAVQAYQRLIELFPQSPQLRNYQAFLSELQKMLQQAPPAKKKR